MATNKWVKEHLEFALKAEDIEEMACRIMSVIIRLSISPLEDYTLPPLSLILEHEQCYSCKYWICADVLGSFCSNKKVKTTNLMGDCISYKKLKED